jgi:hypothetical protein
VRHGAYDGFSCLEILAILPDGVILTLRRLTVGDSVPVFLVEWCGCVANLASLRLRACVIGVVTSGVSHMLSGWIAKNRSIECWAVNWDQLWFLFTRTALHYS